MLTLFNRNGRSTFEVEREAFRGSWRSYDCRTGPVAEAFHRCVMTSTKGEEAGL
jgi:hypothetical protein